jgi:Transport and Golgi organisation 2
MCTLTFVPTENGYVAGMNRDEKLSRPLAIAPKRVDFGDSAAIYPREGSGGTWIACNSRGNLLALLNWNEVTPQCGATNPRSRGLLIPELISAEDLADTRDRFAQQDLSAMSPFRLVGAFLQELVTIEWRWDGSRRQELKLAWERRHWFSSSVSDARATRERGRTCEKAETRHSTALSSWIRSLHQSHDPEPGPFSICVHREDAATVSYTEVRCGREMVSMNYRKGSPCLTGSFGSETSLALDSTAAVTPVKINVPQSSI